MRIPVVGVPEAAEETMAEKERVAGAIILIGLLAGAIALLVRIPGQR